MLLDVEERARSRLVSVVVVLALLASAFSGELGGSVASAAGGTTLSLAPIAREVATGDGDFALIVSINTGGEVVNAVRAYVKFDPAMLQVVCIGAVDSKFPMQWPTTFDNAAGMVDINRTCMGGETFDGAGPVSSIIFRGKAAGRATVELVLAKCMVIRVSDYTNVLAAVGSAVYTVDMTSPDVSLSTTSVTVREGEGSDTYTVALKAPPAADVVIKAVADENVTVSPTVLTFTSTNWKTAQIMTVTAVDDVIAEGTHMGTVAHIVVSTDTGYNALAVDPITATIEDNEFTLAVIVSPATGGSVTRKPDQTSYPEGTAVTLKATPAAGVVFGGWSGGASGTVATVTVAMDADKAVTATFGRDTTRVLTLTIGKYWMYLDGVAVKLDVAAIIQNSRTLLPIRAIAEATGSVVSWDAATRLVTVTRKDRKVELWIGKNVARVNTKATNIDPDDYRVVPIIRNSRTLLPLRFVAESLGLDVQWSEATRTVTVTWRP
jgi:hypothetical protein